MMAWEATGHGIFALNRGADRQMKHAADFCQAKAARSPEAGYWARFQPEGPAARRVARVAAAGPVTVPRWLLCDVGPRRHRRRPGRRTVTGSRGRRVQWPDSLSRLGCK